MSSKELDPEAAASLVSEIVRSEHFRRATFGGAVRGPNASPWVRVIIRPVDLSGQRYVQFSYFDKKKNITKNYNGQDVASRLQEIVRLGFAGIHLETDAEEVDICTTKKGQIFLGRRKVESPGTQTPQPHNRIKDVPLPEGQADRVLEVMGVLTKDGQVRPTMRAKYTQINEFLKQVSFVLEDAKLHTSDREIEILDCGCGSSYLTLAAHHYLNDVLRIPARIMGVDVNEEVIRKSIARSELMAAERVTFACDRIGAIAARPDIVVALHACDTATDDAIAQAITSEARVLLSVPCCHHHLHDRIRPDGPAEVLRPLLRHGILQQRMADLVTDTFRALILRIMGYRTDVIEFISTEHTARNLMIRAVRGVPFGEEMFVKEYWELRQFWGVIPYLEKKLGEPFQRLLSDSSVRAGCANR